MAATTCVILVLIAFALVLGARFLATRRKVANDTAPTRSPEPLSKAKGRAMTAGVAAFVAVTNMPLFVILISSVLEVRGWCSSRC